MTQHLFYSFQSGSTTPNCKISLEDPQVSSDHGMSRMDMGYSGCGCHREEDEAEATEGACRSPHAHWARAAHPRVHICGQLLLFSSLRFRGKRVACSLISLTNQQSPSVVMTTSTSLLPMSSSAVARETRSASAW